jgi:hypothetical protein
VEGSIKRGNSSSVLQKRLVPRKSLSKPTNLYSDWNVKSRDIFSEFWKTCKDFSLGKRCNIERQNFVMHSVAARSRFLEFLSSGLLPNTCYAYRRLSSSVSLFGRYARVF